MSKWTDCADLQKIRELFGAHEFSQAEGQCTKYIDQYKNSADKEPLIGAYLLRAACHAALEHEDSARDDHGTAVRLLGNDASPEDRLSIASDALGYNLPLDYCESMFSELASAFKADGVSPRLTATAFNKLGVCRFRAERPLELETVSFEIANNIINTMEEPDSDDQILSALIKSNLAECLFRGESFDDAEKYYGEASDIFSQRITDSAVCNDQYSMCQRSLYDIHRRRGENVEANRCITNAIDALENHPDGTSENILSQLAGCYNSRGTLRYHIGDYAGEIEDCTASLEIRKGLVNADHYGSATVYSNRAEAYEELEQWDEAAQDYLSAADELKKINEQTPLLQVLSAIWLFACGRVYTTQEKFAQAIEVLTESAALFAAARGAEVENYTPEQLAEGESRCRFYLSNAARQDKHLNYHLSLTELCTAIELIEALPETPTRLFQLSNMHLYKAELYELFDEQELASEEYGASEMLHSKFVDLTSKFDAGEDEDIDDSGDIWADETEDIPQA